MPDREQEPMDPVGGKGPQESAGHRMPDRECSPGAFVRRRRKAGGLTQAELAELAGVGTRFVSELERGKPTLRLDKVNRVLAVFGKCLSLADAPRPEAER